MTSTWLRSSARRPAMAKIEGLQREGIQAVAQEIHLARFLSVTVSDTELAEKAVSAWLEATRPKR